METKIHYHPVLCNPEYYEERNARITASTNIEKVTCPKCMYYYFKPEAKILNDAYDRKTREL